MDAKESKPAGATVWILAWGSRGDFQPFSALGLGLEAAGYRVKVLGQSNAREYFASVGLDFASLDEAIAAPCVTESLQARAQASGLSDADEYCAQSFWQAFDTMCWTVLHALRKKKSEAEISRICAALDVEIKPRYFQTVDEASTYFDAVALRHKESLALQAKDAKMDIETYEELRAQRTQLYLGWFRKLATKGLINTSEVVVDIWNRFWAHYIGTAAAQPDDSLRRKAGVRQLEEMVSWEPGRDPDKWWNTWSEHLSDYPGYKDERVKTAEKAPLGRMCQNMIYAIGRTALSERPAMIIYHFQMIGVALAAQKTYGINTLIVWVIIPPVEIAHQFGHYASLLAVYHDVEQIVGFNPIRDLGPFDWSTMLRSTRQLVAISSVMVVEDLCPPEKLDWLHEFKGTFTGPWVLNDEARYSDSSIFGGPSAMEMIDDFIAASEQPPVYLGWGSMYCTSGPQALATLVVKALKLANLRGVFVAGWSGVTSQMLTEAAAEADKAFQSTRGFLAHCKRDVLFLDAAPHSWLFPKCACIVHHGGAGTLNAALYAGKPSIVIPVGFDQPVNGAWVASQGCGTMMKSLPEVEPGELADVIRHVLQDDAMLVQVQKVSGQVVADGGVPRAVQSVSKLMEQEAGSDHRAKIGISGWGDAPFDWEGTYDILDPQGQVQPHPLVVKGCVAWNPGIPPFSSDHSVPNCWLRVSELPAPEGSTGHDVIAWSTIGVFSAVLTFTPEGKALFSWQGGINGWTWRKRDDVGSLASSGGIRESTATSSGGGACLACRRRQGSISSRCEVQ